eukprot:TRINITY_DN5526_c0_g2_i1.p1 TRINITY_DN5526_c0_g2~~TRINITY_DN5526_c0_g2_i1.p1  ORF type:complete len:226 (+),score=44.95 TRINITY_DN5526_c0_g2_i1:72-680(+)
MDGNSSSNGVIPGAVTAHGVLKQVSEVAVASVIGILLIMVVVLAAKQIHERYLAQSTNQQQRLYGINLSLFSLQSRALDDSSIASTGTTYEHNLSGDFRCEEGLKASDENRVRFSGECPVCLVEYRDKDMLKKLRKCGHSFHQECIDSWLRMNGSCPMCRTLLLPSAADGEPPLPPGAAENEPAPLSHSMETQPLQQQERPQ